ncbi:DNA polymerase III subunit beta [Patescibacteria group bacterium]
MKLECEKELIVKTIQTVEKAVGKNLTLPILSGILLIAKKNTLLVRATNLDIGVEIEIPVKIEKEGQVVIPGSVFSGLLSNIQNDKKITLEEKDGNIIVNASGNKTLIKCFPADEFPTLPIVSNGDGFSIPTQTLVDGIKSVVYSSSLSDVKPELSSVYIYPNEQDVVFVATDSFRLAEKKQNIKNTKDWGGIIIPFKNALDITRVFDTLSGDIDVRFNKNQIVFSLNNIYFTSRIIDGTFPDYKQIIPKEYKTNAIVLKQDIMNVLKIGNIFSGKFNQAVMEIDPSKKVFDIEIKNNDIGENDAKLDATVEGDDVKISFNYKYMLDCLQSIHADSVSIECGGSNMPIVIKGVGDNTFLYLVMPMNR